MTLDLEDYDLFLDVEDEAVQREVQEASIDVADEEFEDCENVKEALDIVKPKEALTITVQGHTSAYPHSRGHELSSSQASG